MRTHTNISTDQLAKFFGRVEKSDKCWLWTGAINSDGYGAVTINNRQWRAHRLSWFIANGPIPEGKAICHRCDVRHCVNPDHLFPGSWGDNNVDAINKRRHPHKAKTHCIRGHEFTPENTRISEGTRHCKECHRLRHAGKIKPIRPHRRLNDSERAHVLALFRAGRTKKSIAQKFGTNIATVTRILGAGYQSGTEQS